jgi:hypothetical protein
MAILYVARSVRMRNERVESQHQTRAEDCDSDVENAREADCPDGPRAVRQAADHHGVYNAHSHPAELRHHERRRQLQHGPNFVGNVVRE